MQRMGHKNTKVRSNIEQTKRMQDAEAFVAWVYGHLNAQVCTSY